jgi:hypothetical protein
MNNLVPREPKKGDIAQRVLKDPGWCNEESADGTWVGDFMFEGFQSGLVLTDPYRAGDDWNVVKMLVDGRILVVDVDTIEAVSCVRSR